MKTEFVNKLYIELENQIEHLAIEVDDIIERAEGKHKNENKGVTYENPPCP